MLAGGRKRGDACTARCLAGDRCLRPRTKWWSSGGRRRRADRRVRGQRPWREGSFGGASLRIDGPKRAAVVRGSAAEHPRWANRRVRGGEAQPRESTRPSRAAIVKRSEHRLCCPSSLSSCLYV